jgi:hypothetical protein
MKRSSAAILALTACLTLPLLLTSATPWQKTASASAHEVPDPEKIDRWTADLGSDDFETREAATRELSKLQDAPPALKKAALEAPDVEVRQRAANILEAIRRNRAERILENAAQFAKQGRVDELVEALVRVKGLDEKKKGWAAAARLAGILAEFEDRDFGVCQLRKYGGLEAGDFDSYMKTAQPKEIDSPNKPTKAREAYLLRGETVEVPVQIAKSIVVASKSAKLTRAEACVVFCSGPVEVQSLLQCIVVCDGTFKAHGHVDGSLVIARGPIELVPTISGVFLTPEELRFSQNCSLHGASRTGEKALPSCVHFFDAADVGIKVTIQGRGTAIIPKGVRVTEVEKGTPFAEAGLQAEDVVLKVSGEEINDEHRRDLQFSRALRRKLAVDEEVTLTVQRDDKVLDLTVRPRD